MSRRIQHINWERLAWRNLEKKKPELGQKWHPTHRNIFEILFNPTEIRLYLPLSDWFGTANGQINASVCFQINRCMVNTIWFRFDLMIFGKYFSVSVVSRYAVRTDKCFLNFAKSTRNQIVFSIFRLISIQTDSIRLDPNQSENGKYNLISGWFSNIQTIFICVYYVGTGVADMYILHMYMYIYIADGLVDHVGGRYLQCRYIALYTDMYTGISRHWPNQYPQAPVCVEFVQSVYASERF